MGRNNRRGLHHHRNTYQLRPGTHPTARADKPPSLRPTAHPVPCRQSVGTTSVTAYRKPVFARAKLRPQPWPTVGCSSFRYLRPACTALPYYHFTTLPVNLTTSSQTLLLNIPCHGASSSALRQSLSFPSQPTPTLRYWRGLFRTGSLLPSFLHTATTALTYYHFTTSAVYHNHRNTYQLGPGTHPTARADKPPSLRPTAHPVPCCQSVGTTFLIRPVPHSLRQRCAIAVGCASLGGSSLRYLRPVSTALSFYYIASLPFKVLPHPNVLLPITSPSLSRAPSHYVFTMCPAWQRLPLLPFHQPISKPPSHAASHILAGVLPFCPKLLQLWKLRVKRCSSPPWGLYRPHSCKGASQPNQKKS